MSRRQVRVKSINEIIGGELLVLVVTGHEIVSELVAGTE